MHPLGEDQPNDTYAVSPLIVSPSTLFALDLAEHNLLLRMSLDIFDIILITTNIGAIDLMTSQTGLAVGRLYRKGG